MEFTLDKFLNDLQSWDIEYNNLKTVLTKEQAISNTTENIYFLAGVKSWLDKRASDSDIISKKYFCIDLDMRNNCNFEITDEDIISEWKRIAKYLFNEDNMLWAWRYIVFSWNWLHIYYTFPEQEFDIENYSYWVQDIYEQWDAWWGDKLRYADHACKNIARILRLPWTINQKNWAKVEIIAYQDMDCGFDIQWRWLNELDRLLYEQDREKRKRLEDFEKKSKIETLITWWSYKSKKKEMEIFFNKLDAIPAYLVSEKLLPQFKFHSNERNFLSDSKKWNRFTWFFYSKDLNAIINWGSSYYNFWETASWYSPTVLVKNHFWMNWKEVVAWFKANFNNIT